MTLDTTEELSVAAEVVEGTFEEDAVEEEAILELPVLADVSVDWREVDTTVELTVEETAILELTDDEATLLEETVKLAVDVAALELTVEETTTELDDAAQAGMIESSSSSKNAADDLVFSMRTENVCELPVTV